jgi:glycosyltransferase involved in cell wall biosynthesis
MSTATTKQNGISVVMNTYNAEKCLPQVLEALQRFDEIVLVDMHSTDNTRSIARSYGARIVDFEHCGICEPARNTAIQAASNPWVLIVDADELVPDELRNYLYATVGRGSEAPAALQLPRRNRFMGREMHCLYPDYVTRFARKDAIRWPEEIHSQPVVDGRVERIDSSRRDLALIHLEENSVASRLEKVERYTLNELHRRGPHRYGAGAYVLKPLGRFFRSYVLKGGWRDGHAGFVWALLEAHYKLTTLLRQDEAARK